ncbi:protein of unknown function [Methylacidimicrobium sp. AP8]|uniref:hypothetical protein n=1 Tax=Methylacidimicrobium sp. AP8 TaxID=2730359 RepID=UPI0018C055F3|nr:hypothetical protein [Methylacidimicrobium sp. AP8]CAB4242874.1 protein of unknown function [Methylacidimicrobium sp. AP8]
MKRPQAQPTDRNNVSSGLGDPEVDRLLNLSPCARTMLQEAISKGYEIKWGEVGKGTYCIPGAELGRFRRRGKIVIDSSLKGDPALVASALCHELGHPTDNPFLLNPVAVKMAEWVEENLVPLAGQAALGPLGGAIGRRAGRAAEAWIEDASVAFNTRQCLTDEGHADMKLAACVAQAWAAVRNSGDRRLQQEVSRMWNDGDVGLRAKEMALWNAMQEGKITAKKAEEQVGEYFADHEHPSTDLKKTYRKHYEEAWRKEMALHPEANQPRRQPAPEELDRLLANSRALAPQRTWEGRGTWRRDSSRSEAQGRDR